MNDPEVFFANENIELYALLDFANCKITNIQKMNRQVKFTPRSVIITAVPYFTGIPEKSNISLYAMSYDYHIYMNDMLNRLCTLLKNKYDDYNFKAFSDSSPIDERHAAAIGGLGVYGDNHLLITEKYGSYVFLGEIISDMDVSKYSIKPKLCEIRTCRECQRCKMLCPYEECSACLSELTQRKGELTEHDFDMMVKYSTVWGCDICQSACPLNRRAEITPVQFFHGHRTTYLTYKDIEEMDDEEFGKRAFSWRGKKILLRNLEQFEKKTDKKD